MAKETRKRKGRDPNQDVQPWLGWVAALLIVLVVVVAVAMGMERTNGDREPAATVAMTPLVGGMALAAVTTTPGEVAAAGAITVEIAPTATAAPVVTSTAALTGTDGVTATSPVTATGELTQVEVVTATAAPTTTAAPAATTIPITETVPVATPVPTATVRPSPTPTAAPTTVPTRDARTFAPGDVVVSAGGRVALYADVATASALLDTYGVGVQLTVVEPNGDYTEYPVTAEGENWLRVRAQDGLVGWVLTSAVVKP